MSYYDEKNRYVQYGKTNVCPHNENVPYSIWRLNLKTLEEPFPKYDLEILAPATASSYKSAVRYGANALYFEQESIGADADCNKFEEIIDFCHIYGVKAYLAINAVFKDKELAIAEKLIIRAEKADIDAFIIADLTLLSIIRKHSKACVYASERMGVHNRFGGDFCKKYGFDRVFLSREMNCREICDVINNCDIPAGIFGHGTSCSGFGGACLMSAMLMGKSANKGKCERLCRRRYAAYADGRKIASGYLLSAKDICMAGRLNEIKRAKIASLTLEGATKSDEYVTGVSLIYSKLKNDEYLDPELRDMLQILYNEGNFCESYWSGSDIIAGEIPARPKVFAGKITHMMTSNSVLISVNKKVQRNDVFKIVRNGKEICRLVATGEYRYFMGDFGYIASAEGEAREGDELYLVKTRLENVEPNKIIIEVGIRIMPDGPIHIIATSKGEKYEYWGEIPTETVYSPLTQDDMIRQFQEQDTEFDIVVVSVCVGDVYLSAGRTNEWRRAMTDYFTEIHLKNYRRKVSNFNQNLQFKAVKKIQGNFIEVSYAAQVTKYVRNNVANIVYSPETYTEKGCLDFYRKFKTDSNLIFIKFPMFIPSVQLAQTEIMTRIFDGVVANNLGMLEMAFQYGKLAVAGYNLNVMNTKNPLLKIADQTIISPELNVNELKRFHDCLVYAFGYMPLMHLNHCPKKVAGISCADCKNYKSFVYKDGEREYRIAAKKMGKYCRHELKNGVLTNLGEVTDGDIFKYFDFTEFFPEEIDDYLSEYIEREKYNIADFGSFSPIEDTELYNAFNADKQDCGIYETTRRGRK